MSRARVEVWRGSVLESVHRVSVAVADAAGRLRGLAGDPTRPIWARSVVKPLQALPLVDDGVADRFAVTDAELAVCCASHGGEAEHVRLVESLLAKAGVGEDALACGAHAPYTASARAELRAGGERPRRIHNNCSGKHAGMLLLARHHGWPVEGYHEPGHEVQKRMLAEIAGWTHVSPADIGVAVDGCGVSTYALSLALWGGALARFGAAAKHGAAAARVARSMAEYPHAVAGEGRLCTELLRLTGGRVLPKVGAEGVYGAVVPGAELGVAIKVEDGGTRAAGPALIAVLDRLGLLNDEERDALVAFATPSLTNTRGETVGRIVAAVELEAGRE